MNKKLKFQITKIPNYHDSREKNYEHIFIFEFYYFYYINILIFIQEFFFL